MCPVDCKGVGQDYACDFCLQVVRLSSADRNDTFSLDPPAHRQGQLLDFERRRPDLCLRDLLRQGKQGEAGA